jgi:hypothetical protein
MTASPSHVPIDCLSGVYNLCSLLFHPYCQHSLRAMIGRCLHRFGKNFIPVVSKTVHRSKSGSANIGNLKDGIRDGRSVLNKNQRRDGLKTALMCIC